MTARPRHPTFDCADPYALATFWSRVTGYKEDPDTPTAPGDDAPPGTPEGFAAFRADREAQRAQQGADEPRHVAGARVFSCGAAPCGFTRPPGRRTIASSRATPPSRSAS